MYLKPNQVYTVVKKIKIHTKPLVEVVVPQTGLFVRETSKYFCFSGFKVRKDCVLSVKEQEKESISV